MDTRLLAGTAVGKYRITEHLGSGSTGSVYRAIDETLGRDVALKVLSPSLADAEGLRRFRAEATTLARLNHQEIATIYDLLQSGDDVVMVMELVPGETLERMCDRLGPLSPAHAAQLLDGVLAGLEYTHRAGIVHRDMKPANVMVSEGRLVKIMDFGIAAARGAESGPSAGLRGTPAYMPPEQVLGQDVDHRTDLYAVGVMFYRLLTGALPFDGSTIEAMLQQQVSDRPTPLRQHRDDLPAWCDDIVTRALAKTPADRFQTATEFRAALARGAESTAIGRVESLTSFAAATVATAMSEAGRRIRARSVSLPALSARRVAMSRVRLLALSGTAAATVVVIVALTPTPRTPPVGRDDSHPAEATPAVVAAAGPVTPVSLDGPPSPQRPSPVEVGASRPRSRVAKPHVAALLRAPWTQLIESTPKAPAEPAERAEPIVAAAWHPLAFDAKVLVADGKRHRERDVNLRLADGKLVVTAASTPDQIIHSQPYTAIVSVDYSNSTRPLRNSPAGPLAVAPERKILGLFPRSRRWVTLRTNDKRDPLIVLRFDDDGHATRAVEALATRTRRVARLVTERTDSN
jgi:eukaryotic-like serine/threonine-protein kinase